MLSSKSIKNALKSLGFHQEVAFFCFETLASTNSYLKSLPTEPTMAVCLAETQTQGRGRLGKIWHSPPGGNLYFSMRISVSQPLANLKALSLICGLSLVSTLKTFDSHAKFQLKWPNDLLYENKKLGGILIEILRATPFSTIVVVGIGLNLSHPPKQLVTDQTITSVNDIINQAIDRHLLVAKLIQQLTRDIEKYAIFGFHHFQAEWQKIDYLAGKTIQFQQDKRLEVGLVIEVNSEGLLIVQRENQKKTVLLSADTLRVISENVSA